MKRLFRKLALPVKLWLLGLVPLVFLIFFSVQIYHEKNEKIKLLDSYIRRIRQSTNLTELVSELHKERRYSFGYFFKEQLRTEMILQRTIVDEKIRNLENDKDAPLTNLSQYTSLNKLPGIRTAIDNRQVSADEVMNFYTLTVFRLNTLNSVPSGNVGYLQPISQQLTSQKLLTEMVTYLGIIRGNIYQVLYTRQGWNLTRDNLKNTYEIYLTYEKELLLKSSPTTLGEYKNLLTNSALQQTLGYLDTVLNRNQPDSTYNADEWWNISAAAVDQLRGLQNKFLTQVQSGLDTIYLNEIRERDRTLLLLSLSVIFVIGIITYTITSITDTLTELKTNTEKIAIGSIGVSFSVESKDVIGSLVASIAKIEHNNKILAKAAMAIGNGDFEAQLTPRSSEDILGNALVSMKTDLQRYNQENTEKGWIHEGIETINSSLQGIKGVTTLAKDAIRAFALHLDAEVGLLYTHDHEKLRFEAGYALADTTSIQTELKLGETLLGEAALKKKPILLTEVPEDFVRIATASGNARPRQVLIVPLIHNQHTEGVLEVASLKPFSAASLSFAKQVQASIAVALHTAKNRARLQELLEETQVQAEELQTQHSELENINAELEVQTQKLQASEEELKVQQEELLQANQELEERSRLLEERNQVVVERNLEIQKKAEELARSTKYKSEFLANMSHELRTPLNSILLLSRLLAENTGQSLTKDQVEYARVIQSSGQGLLALIDEILDLSRIESGKMELEYKPVLISEIATGLQALFAPIAREKNLAFEINTAENVPSLIETDQMRLEQILKNLISNALKFTARGSVQLQINAQDQSIAFTVKDTGIGIAPDNQQHIFDAFQQADGSTRRKYGGTGLGLSISRELTKLLGGEIKVDSETGKGSTFTVTVPVHRSVQKKPQKAFVDSAATSDLAPEDKNSILPEKYHTTLIPEAVPDDRASISPGDKVILIVEDDTPFARTLLDYTRKKGYKGIVTVRGDEALPLALQYKPIGILLDIQLPVKDGWQVMEELKADRHTRPIPVHIMSSHQVKKESLLKGAVDFINKPIAFEQMQEIFQKIEQVLSKVSKKVLIVEENPRHAKALAYFLETFHVNSEISNTVADSISALEKAEVNCVILDMGIPDQNSYEILETIKQKPGLENLPIIIFTGKSLSKSEESKIRQYADSIVIKTAHSYQRILDEVSLFLHLVEEHGTADKSGTRKADSSYQKMGALGEVLNNQKILVADDDVRNIFSLTKALELQNMCVLSAIDGKEALQRIAEHPDIDLILMDIMMPEMDGYQAIRHIRQQPRYRNLPIIAVTAKAMTGDREKCIEAGASDYISKPIDIDQLLSLLRVWLYDKGI